MKKALVLAFALVLGLGIAAFAGSPLSGSWTSSLTLDIQTSGAISVSDFSSTLEVDYTVGGWTFVSTTGFTLGGWNTQEFTANGTLGAFTIDSDLVFDPAGASFTKWDTTGSVSIAGVDFSGEFLLTSSASAWKFGASGNAGDLSISATAFFNGELDADGNLVAQTDSYCFCFSSVEFDVSFPFACIDKVDASIAFSQSGFDGVTFSVSGVDVPGISWLSFDLSLKFDDGTAGKSLSVTPNISLGDWACIELYYDLITGTGTAVDIEGIEFYGVSLSYTWNGVTFKDISLLDVDKYISLIDPSWPSAYWELFEIKSAGDSCCGGAVDFSIDTYFSQSSTMLFDWGETDVSLSFGIGSNFTLNTGLVVDTTGLTQVSAGFTVTW